MKYSYIMILFLILSIPTVFSTVLETTYILEVQSASLNPTKVYANDTFTIKVDLKNKASYYDATNVNLRVELPEVMEGVKTEAHADAITPGQTVSLVLEIKAKENAIPSDYTLPIYVTYNRAESELTEKYSVTATISRLIKLDNQDIKLSDNSPHIGDTLTISSKVKNVGNGEARTVSVTLKKSDSSDFGNFIVLSDTKIQLGNISPGKTTEVSFKIMPGKKITPGTYTFQLDSNCTDCPELETEKISFEVLGKPNLIISGIDFSVEGKQEKKILQGDAFSVSVQLDNIGEEKAKAVEVLLESDPEIVGIKKAYVGNIDNDDSGTAIFDLIANDIAKEGEHNIKMTVKYKDELGQEKSFEDNYSIYLNKKPEPSIVVPLVLVIIILVLAYFTIKMVFRQLALRKME
ncbi:MAG: hypothetical protein COT15_02985 [Candidatus Diapherotrites archaeon CG08_land_8_20_14_0_20_34_12]|nr:MAG: hypothetical protein COT15_02985 [Candidatus Diapherotrites archaeon CG08_land_8_20_14_0_20_34_12]